MITETVLAIKEVLCGYYNKILLDKLSSEEVLQMLESDIKNLRTLEGDSLLNNSLTNNR